MAIATSGFQDDSGAVVIEARFINCLGWPHTLKLEPTQIADGFGVTRYVKVPPPADSSSDSDPWTVAQTATHTRQAILRGGLPDLDGLMVPPPAGLVALGGQTGGFAGFLPGVAEEIAMALEQGIAVYVLGGFGGAAEQAALVMSGAHSDAFTFDSFMTNEKYQALSEAAKGRGRADEMDRRLQWLQRQLARGLQNGLTKQENALLWGTENVGEAVALISRGLKRTAEGKPDRTVENAAIKPSRGTNPRRKPREQSSSRYRDAER